MGWFAASNWISINRVPARSARKGLETACKQRELDVANAERTVDREREQLAIAAAEMRRVEAELHAAQAAGDATSIRAAEDALRAVRAR